MSGAREREREHWLVDDGKKEGYLRFRYSFNPSRSVMYSNPASSSSWSSLMLLAVLHV